MATQEFYIRGENDTEARGPFTQEQLASLVEAAQLTPDTLYYDATIEQWVAVSSNASLMAFLFPEKKKLRVRAKENVATLNVQGEHDAPIRVEDMLAAAEGRTVETIGRGDPKLTAARIAIIGRYCLAVGFLVSVFSGLLAPLPAKPEENGLFLLMDPAARWKEIVADPFVMFGLVDVLLVGALLLGATAFYPLVRFRALLALGFFSLICFLSGQFQLLGAVAAASIGIYLTTIAITWIVLIPGLVLTLGGMAALAYFRVLQDLMN